METTQDVVELMRSHMIASGAAMVRFDLNISKFHTLTMCFRSLS
jgi:hypothetical protein